MRTPSRDHLKRGGHSAASGRNQAGSFVAEKRGDLAERRGGEEGCSGPGAFTRSPWKEGGSNRGEPPARQRRQRATRSPPPVRTTSGARLQAPYPTLRASPRGLRATPRRTQSCKCAVRRDENPRGTRGIGRVAVRRARSESWGAWNRALLSIRCLVAYRAPPAFPSLPNPIPPPRPRRPPRFK